MNLVSKLNSLQSKGYFVLYAALCSQHLYSVVDGRRNLHEEEEFIALKAQMNAQQMEHAAQIAALQQQLTDLAEILRSK